MGCDTARYVVVVVVLCEMGGGGGVECGGVLMCDVERYVKRGSGIGCDHSQMWWIDARCGAFEMRCNVV